MAAAPTQAGAIDAGANHRTALDGLRAFAIAGVMLVHAGAPGARSGWVGVDLFFVLSGFLITTLLAMEINATGGIAWGPFMARRALRLMPAYFLYAGAVTLAIWCWPGSVRGENGGWTAGGLTAALWTYTINFVPQGGVWNGQDATVHLWSLAVEQQYYLVWPVAMLLLARRPAALRAVAAVGALACAALFIASPPGLYKVAMLWTRGFSLVAASALALRAAADPGFLRRPAAGRAVDALGVALLAALAVAPYHAGWSEDRVRTVFIPLLVPVFAIWVARLWYVRGSGLVRRVLQDARVVYVGKISYGVYLYHEAVRIGVWAWMKPWMAGWPAGPGFVLRMAVYVAVSLALAAISYECFEKRFLRLAGRFRPRRVT
jgi:peptidoglycan/LPS O-acetylase OafA/YrhL